MDETPTSEPLHTLRRSDRSVPTRLSLVVSAVLHPLFVPFYVVLLLVAGPTQLAAFPPSVRFYQIGRAHV